MAYIPTSDNQIFIQTADKTVTNTAAETSALGVGTGSKMIKSDVIKVGSRIRIHGEGVYSTPLLTSGITIRVKLGNTVVATITTSSIVTGASSRAFTFDCILVFRSVGATGSVVAGGTAAYTTILGAKAFDDLDNQGNPVTVDTTSDMAIDVTVQWDFASSSRILKTTIASITLV